MKKRCMAVLLTAAMLMSSFGGISQVSAKEADAGAQSPEDIVYNGELETANTAEDSEKQNAGGVYLEKDKRLVINAKDALEKSRNANAIDASDGHTWVETTDGVKVVEDKGMNWSEGSWAALNGIAPALQFTINISNAGDYYLWVNMSNPNNAGDSYHVAVDEKFAYTGNTGEKLGEKTWFVENKKITLAEGGHTLTIFAREDGVTLNQIVLTQDVNAVFQTGTFEAPSERDQLKTDFTVLQNAVNQAVSEDKKGEYTEETWMLYEEALSVARNVLSNEKASQTEVDDAADALIKAQSGLVKKPVNPDAKGVYLESDGKLVISAKDALEKSESAKAIDASDGHTWAEMTDGVKVVEDKGDSWRPESWDALNGIAPALQFTIKISNAGDYYLWVNMSNPNDAGDSYHVAVDEKYAYIGATGQQLGEKAWFGEKIKISLAEGGHTLTIFAREDGVTLNQIVLTKDGNAVFQTGVFEEPSKRNGKEDTYVPLTNISIAADGDSKEIMVDEQLQLTAVVAPENATNKDVTWTSSNTEVATVDESGVVTGVKAGTVTITATAKDESGVSGSVDIKVVKHALIADFNFDSQDTGFKGAGAVAHKNGAMVLVDHEGGKALELDNSAKWLEVKKEDGTSLLSGLNAFTVSYDCKPEEKSGSNWVFYASHMSGDGTAARSEYIGISHYLNKIDALSYQTTASTPTQTLSGWHHVDVIFAKDKVAVYVDRVEVKEMPCTQSLKTLLGDSSTALIGKANWHEGQYFKGQLDNFKVYNYALSEEEIKAEKQKQLEIIVKSENDVMGTVVGAGTYNEGTEVTLEATAKEGYRFVGWYVGEECVSEESTLSVTVNEESAAKEYMAKFSKTLEAIKADAIAELESYKNKDDYRADEQATLSAYIEAGTNAINDAETEDAVKAALEEAKTSLDGIATDLRLTTTEYEDAVQAAEDFLLNYMSEEIYIDYLENEQISYEDIMGKAEESLNGLLVAETATLEQMKDATIAINKLIAEAKAEIDALPTAADLTVTAVSIKDGAELAIQVDTTYVLGVDVTGGAKADKKVTWSSDNTAVATVAEDGTVTAVSAGTAIITAQVKENPESGEVVEATITITVEPRKYEVRIKNGEAVEKIGEFEEWAFAKVEAPAAPKGMKFAYWKTDAGKIVCYAPNYSFYVMQDVTLEPVYVADETAVEEQVTILCTASYNKSTKKVSFTSKRSLPAGYTVVSHGIVITDSTGWGRFNQDASKLVINASRTKKSVATTTGRLGTYVARMACTASDTWYGRAYVTYKDKNGEEHTVYSDGVASCQVDVN